MAGAQPSGGLAVLCNEQRTSNPEGRRFAIATHKNHVDKVSAQDDAGLDDAGDDDTDAGADTGADTPCCRQRKQAQAQMVQVQTRPEWPCRI